MRTRNARLKAPPSANAEVKLLAERVWFALCFALGVLLRTVRYSRTVIVLYRSDFHVRKWRRWYAPPLVALGNPLARALDTGVRVLSQREWEERERLMYNDLYGASIDVAKGALILPRFRGETLASMLEHVRLAASTRKRAIELAVVALRELHAKGHTHGDAMADNVMIDIEERTARWFDFETAHDHARPAGWRRADDVRALLATCLARTAPTNVPATLELILAAYGDDGVTRQLRESFAPLRPSLIFHLGQAPLSFRTFSDIARLILIHPTQPLVSTRRSR